MTGTEPNTPFANLPAPQLNPAFTFTQSSLQDISECRRRFYLRYLLNLSWPAPVAEPIHEIEKQMLLGATFHNIVYQYYLEIPLEKLEPQVQNEPLSTWWNNFLAAQRIDPLFNQSGVQYRVEHTTAIPFHGFRLLAKYDLVIEKPGSNTEPSYIIDWKTSPKMPKRSFIEQRLQTIVYPFVFHQAKLAKAPYASLEMIYWYTNFPDLPERFVYSEAQQENAQQVITGLIDLVTGTASGKATVEQRFPMTSDSRHCRFCVYRSLCGRGDRAGVLFAEDSDPDFGASEAVDDVASFTLENITEIEF